MTLFSDFPYKIP